MGSLGDNVLGEVLKGVFNWVLSMNLKFKRLDDGLVAVRVSEYPGIRLNSKVVIFDNHLTLIYFTCGKTI